MIPDPDDLAKVGAEGSNPFARSSFSPDSNGLCLMREKRIRPLSANRNATVAIAA
jgi:hypothetical protein